VFYDGSRIGEEREISKGFLVFGFWFLCDFLGLDMKVIIIELLLCWCEW